MLGLDYVFYHRFLNNALQEQLREMRYAIYHQEEPPRPLSLEGAARWADSVKGDPEVASRQARQAAATLQAASTSSLLPPLAPEPGMTFNAGGSPRQTDLLLLAAFNEPGWPKAMEEGVANVCRRLEALEEELPAAHGSLHLALVCGTSPIPPGLRIRQELRQLPSVGLVPAFVLDVFSAKERDLRSAYQEATASFQYTKRDAFPLQAAWGRTDLLPYLELVCTPLRGKLPTPSAVQREFRRQRSPVTRFYDGNIRTREYEYALRTWALHLLTSVRRLTNREAIERWNESAPTHLRYKFEEGKSETQTGESLLSQELARLRKRIKSWQE